MTAILGKAGRNLFAKHLQQYAPADPLYEYYTNEKGRKKRRKRETPPGLSVRDAKILKSVCRRAHYLDKGFNVCGMRFGWAFIIAVIPGVGDVADIFLNYYLVLRKARQADLPDWLVRRMLVNNMISALVGFVPFAGDIILAQYKANWRNAALLAEFLRIRGEVYLEMKAERQKVIQAGGATPQDTDKGKNRDESSDTQGKKKQETKGANVGDGKEVTIPEDKVHPDVKQIKPGAGLKDGEVIPDLDPPVDVSAALNESASAKKSETVPTSESVSKKKTLGFPMWRGKSKGKVGGSTAPSTSGT